MLVGENWQCHDCVEGRSNLCEDCMASWLHELTRLNYLAYNERKLVTITGVATLIMGIVALLGNASMGLWQESALIAFVSISIYVESDH